MLTMHSSHIKANNASSLGNEHLVLHYELSLCQEYQG